MFHKNEPTLKDFPMRDQHKKQAELHIKAHGKAIVWFKNGKVRLLDPEEVFIVLK